MAAWRPRQCGRIVNHEMVVNPAAHGVIDALSAFLHHERSAVLRTWRQAVDADPTIATAATLARVQFVDHIPAVLDALTDHLVARDDGAQRRALRDERERAAEHGLQRWIHGYGYRETMREWGHLQLAVTDSLEAFAAARPPGDAAALTLARRRLAEFFVECSVESAAQHVSLQEAAAAARLSDLEQVLQEVRTLEQSRAELWREAAHDLRGNVGVVRTAAAVVGRSGAAGVSQQALSIVQRGAESLTTLLDDLIGLARLEAGREQRRLHAFDVAALVRDMGAALQPLATERRLFLKVEGPASLGVVGDRTKTERIAQNLLLNALKYTDRGGVHVRYESVSVGDVPSWRLTVHDTGPGLTGGAAAPLAEFVRSATDEEHPGGAPAPVAPAPVQPPRQNAGEGVGFTIVKRLCELLDATLELDSAPARGTTVTVTFPQRYDDARP